MARKNDAMQPAPPRFAESNANFTLQIAGQDPIFLGTLDIDDARMVMLALEAANACNLFIDDALLRRERVRANPAQPKGSNARGVNLNLKKDKEFALKLLGAPSTVMSPRKLKNALLPTRCLVGGNRAVKYPISVDEVQDISLEVATANLAVFYPVTARMLPKRVLDEFDNSKNVTAAFVSKLSKQDMNALRKAAKKFTEEMLRSNTKLEQSKIPADTGIGAPSDVEGYNLSPTGGTVGLNLMNAMSLLGGEDQTDMRGFKQIIDDYLSGIEQGTYHAKLKSDNKDTNVADDSKATRKTRQATTEFLRTVFSGISYVLSQFESKNATCCPYASADCIGNCLFMSGNRASQSLVHGKDITIDETAVRLLAGYYHTAFIANPYYFLRLLIDAIYTHANTHIAALCMYNAEAYNDPSKTRIENFDDYIKIIPPTVRLNVYSDYIWEMIYSDMFTLFDIDRPRRFANYSPASVMFYDYTKIPGRWRNEQREILLSKLGAEWSEDYAYNLPRNYHLTFSFSGSDASYRHSQVANLAGQNSTFVFSTASLSAERVRYALRKTVQEFRGRAGSEVLDKLQGIASDLERILLNAFSERFTTVKVEDFTVSGQQHIGQRYGKEFVLPQMYAASPDGGYTKVISGDLYDSRYLDEYLKESPDDAVIVGLGWKTPRNITMTINGKSSEIQPSIGALYLENEDSVPNAAQGVDFAIARYNLGKMVQLKEGDTEKLFSVFITAQRPGQTAVNELISDIAEYGGDAITGIQFATETGLPINTMMGNHMVEFVLVNSVRESIEETLSAEDIEI